MLSGSWNLQDQIPDTCQFRFFPIFYLFYHLNLSYDPQNLLLVTVDMASFYQSHVNCRSRKLKADFMDKVSYHYCCHFPGLVIYTPTCKN
jgi:hypothetical protein